MLFDSRVFPNMAIGVTKKACILLIIFVCSFVRFTPLGVHDVSTVVMAHAKITKRKDYFHMQNFYNYPKGNGD